MPSLPRARWPSICATLDRALAASRPPIFKACLDALGDAFPAFPRHAFLPYSPARHAPYLTAGQLVSASYLIWKRAYVSSAEYEEFIRFLWADVLGQHFVTASAMLDRLAIQSATRFEQLFSLFSGLLADAPPRDRPAYAMLLVCRQGLPLVASSFDTTARVCGDPVPIRVAFHDPRSSPASPFFDAGLPDHVRGLARTGARVG